MPFHKGTNVYTFPEQVNYSGMPYLNPNNLNERIMEDKVCPDFEMPKQVASQNVYDPSRRPSDNLAIKTEIGKVPLQYTTYDMLDSRNGSSEFNAPIPQVGAKLMTKQQLANVSYTKNISPQEISFESERVKTGEYPSINSNLENIASLIDSRRPIAKLNNSTMVSNRTTMASDTQFQMAQSQAQQELQMFEMTGKWM